MVTCPRLPFALILSALVFVASTGAAGTNVALIPAETVWKYRADGIDLGLAWRGAAFDDAAWQSAQAEIGFGDGGERTALALGQAPTTIYFRRSFEVSNPSAFKSLLLRFIRDDGAVFYLNGVELFRSNMPEGNIDSSTSAVAGVEYPLEGNYLLARVSAEALVQGKNVLAVEIHQSVGGEADMSFDAELFATTADPPVFIVRGPYLQRLSPSQVTIRWRTDVPTASHVVCGRSPTALTQLFVATEETIEHEIIAV